MINRQLIRPESIAVVGGSNDISKPGGKVLKNIIDGGYTGNLYVVNHRDTDVQGLNPYKTVADLPETDLAVIAIPAAFVPEAVEMLAAEKKTRAFIIITAGFGEHSPEGKELERQITGIINRHEGVLIGPNCIGVLTPHYHGVFTEPIPHLHPQGCDFISGSGATACFIMEAGIPKGLTFANVFSVGNSAQIGVEEVLEYMDESFDPSTSSRVKMLYLENLAKPQKLYRHAVSLIRKGCMIAAIKAGGSEAGSRAASSHTGALASSDMAVEALFRKAGIVRCHSREELIAVASIFMHPELKGKRIAVITHAGGPGVMLTDALAEGGLEVPPIEGEKAEELKTHLFPGSSVGNPIDFLATGTAEQLGLIIDYTNSHFSNIDAMVIIFGSPGLFQIDDVYDMLHRKMKTSPKPVYPVLPSILTSASAVQSFMARGNINFPDEVVLGHALTKVARTPGPAATAGAPQGMDTAAIRRIIDSAGRGYLSPEQVGALLAAAGISAVLETVVHTRQEAASAAERLGLPVVMKVIGPVHKTDVGGVVLGVETADRVEEEFGRLIAIPEATGVLIQPMVRGMELFAGAKREGAFGHLVLCGLGGIFVEVLKDYSFGLAPLTQEETLSMIQGLRSYHLMKGIRGRKSINMDLYADILVRLSHLVTIAPEIEEMDLNPLIASEGWIKTVDARIAVNRE
ncbi:MAG: acetate--CoA ligase family protein [Bacteroidales bacterium]|nr:acetate--CoA ligase family protein [Bacteroidales bacterium]